MKNFTLTYRLSIPLYVDDYAIAMRPTQPLMSAMSKMEWMNQTYHNFYLEQGVHGYIEISMTSLRTKEKEKIYSI